MMMIKIIAGTIFGVFFVAPTISMTSERFDTSGIQEIFSNLGKEILRVGLDVISNAI